ncbi:MAG: hypothetical protein ACT4P2_12530 [Pseudomonadota bacterium]
MTGDQNQDLTAADPSEAAVLAAAMPAARMTEYLVAAGHDASRAAVLYVWDLRLAQAFHLPLHVAELMIRNALDGIFRRQFGNDWPNARAFVTVLDRQRNGDLVIARQRLAVRRMPFDVDRIVATLPFGFWVGMLAPRYGPPIWHKHLRAAFPDLPTGRSNKSVNLRARAIGELRNRIYHHKPLLGRDLSAEHARLIEILGWISPNVAAWLGRQS